jgi:hypothetical protein
MKTTNLAVKDFIKISLFTKIQLYKNCVLYGFVFKTICAIRVISCSYFLGELRDLTKNKNFVVFLCAICVLCDQTQLSAYCSRLTGKKNNKKESLFIRVNPWLFIGGGRWVLNNKNLCG